MSVPLFFSFFLKVHLCEIENPQDLPNLEFPFNVRKGRPLLVAVKILRPDASKNARSVTSTQLQCGSVFLSALKLNSSPPVLNVFTELHHYIELKV